jgi:hypothetical protein
LHIVLGAQAIEQPRPITDQLGIKPPHAAAS